MVARLLREQEVAGSNPVAPTNTFFLRDAPILDEIGAGSSDP